MTKKQKIVFVIHELKLGGAERVIVSLMNHISREKYTIHLIVFKDIGELFDEVRKDVTIHSLKSSSVKKGILSLIGKIYHIQPDIVFSGIGFLNAMLSFFIPLLNLISRSKIYWIARETSIVSLRKEKYPNLIPWLYRNSYKNFDRIICQSEYMREDLLKNYDIPSHKVTVINNPVDTDKIKQRALEPLAYSFPKNKINIVAVGSLRYVKRFDLLLEAFALLGDGYTLTIVGKGEEILTLKAQSIRLGIDGAVNFVGQQSNPYGYMKRADVLVLTSEFEGFPNVLLEANSCGTPVIAFDCPGGTRDIIKEGLNGILVPCKDIKALAQAIKSYKKFNFDTEAICSYISSHYGLSEIIKKYEKLFDREEGIVFLINSLAKGGAERAMVTMTQKLLDQGNRVRLISLNINNRYPIPKGLEMIYLSKMDDSEPGYKRLLAIPYYAWKLRNYSRREGITLIQSHLFRANYVNLLSQMLGAKHRVQVVNRSIASRFVNEGLNGKINLYLMRYLYPKAELIISISKKMADDLQQLFGFTNPQKVIYNPYDIKRIKELSGHEVTEFRFDPSKYYLISVGRLIPLKRYEDTFEVLRELPDNIELIVLGDGLDKKRLIALRSKLGLNNRIHLLGEVLNPYKFIKRADLFVSTSFVEGFPNVLIESMLCKTAVISTDCISGPREILAPKTDINFQLKEGIEEAEYGILFPVGDRKALKEAINLLYHDARKCELYVRCANKRAHDFSVESIVKEYKEVMSIKK